MSGKMFFEGAVFDGERVRENAVITVENDSIISVEEGKGACGDGFWMPGLIDAHTHLNHKGHMDELTRCGVTTTCAVGVPKERQEQSDGLRIWTSRTMAMGHVTDGREYVESEVAKGADYIKVILEDPARMAKRVMPLTVLKDIAECAHEHGRKVAAHAVDVSMVRLAVQAGVDVLLHVPMREPLPQELAEQIAKQNMAVVPTLVMMEAFCKDPKFPVYQPQNYENAEYAVRLLRAAGVPILVGTDASEAPYVPKVWHGASMHRELELLVKAGLTPLEALQGATQTAARVFGLNHIGMMAPGYKADLVLTEGRPEQCIADSVKVRQVWIGGRQYR